MTTLIPTDNSGLNFFIKSKNKLLGNRVKYSFYSIDNIKSSYYKSV
jgi:hypothetical protein